MKSFLVALCLFVVSCGVDKPDSVDARESALGFSTLPYCNASNDPSCMSTQSAIAIGQFYTCGGLTLKPVIYRATQNATNPIFGPVTWTENIQTVPAGMGFDPGLIFVELSFARGGSFNMPLTQGNGLLYLSQTLSGRMARYNAQGQLVSWAGITILGGNFQYYPETAQDPHGRWCTWISAPSDPANGVCGNMQFCWGS